MSLLLKALQQADRGSNLSLEPMEDRVAETPAAPPASAKAAAALMFQKQANAEKRRMLILLGVLVAVVLGMGIYFYLAVFMPWIFLPKPATVTAPPAVLAPAVPVQAAPVPAPPSAALPVAALPAAPIPAEPRVEAKNESGAPRTRKTEAAPAPAATPAPAQDAGIQISGGRTAPSTANSVQHAYQLLQEGRLEEARRAYENLRAQEPNNADVLLGLALIAQRQGRTDEAAQLYLKALNADPKNAFAQASLSGLIARVDPAAAEGKLKALIAQQPAAFLHFGLGNVYAAQGRWNEAQAAYFEAQRLDPEAPDYAFNLAISLERIKQPRAALDYYQRALKLSQGKPATFDAAQVRARIQQLSVVK